MDTQISPVSSGASWGFSYFAFCDRSARLLVLGASTIPFLSFMFLRCICHLTGEHFPERPHSSLNVTIISVLDGGPVGIRSGQRMNDASFFLLM